MTRRRLPLQNQKKFDTRSPSTITGKGLREKRGPVKTVDKLEMTENTANHSHIMSSHMTNPMDADNHSLQVQHTFHNLRLNLCSRRITCLAYLRLIITVTMLFCQKQNCPGHPWQEKIKVCKSLYHLNCNFNSLPADTRRWINVGLTLDQRRRRWTNVKPTLIQRADTRCWINVGLTLDQRRRRWTNVKPTLIQRLVSVGYVNFFQVRHRYKKINKWGVINECTFINEHSVVIDV